MSIVRGRKHVSRVPLFPGYVFMAGTRELAFPTVTAKRVCQVLPVHDQDAFVEQIELIRHAIDAGGAGIELYPHAVIGHACRVTAGPLKGTEGTITERLGPSRLVLSVDILGQGAALEIDADLLEPID
ncbi:MAG: transcription termination/antitermination protein NusG [Planctomycetota bacterium]